MPDGKTSLISYERSYAYAWCRAHRPCVMRAVSVDRGRTMFIASTSGFHSDVLDYEVFD